MTGLCENKPGFYPRLYGSNFPPLENSVSACVYVVYHIMCQQHTEHRVMRYLADFVLVRDQVMAA